MKELSVAMACLFPLIFVTVLTGGVALLIFIMEVRSGRH